VEGAVLTERITAVGSLRSNESVVIRPEITGRIADLPFREGQTVQKGTVLVRLDDSVTQAELAEAQARLNLAERNFERAKDLLDRGAGTARSRDEARGALDSNRASVQLARARLDKTVIRAPFEGILGLRNVSVGAYVSPGQDLTSIDDIDPIKVDFRVPERMLSALSKDQRIRITVDAFPEREFEGQVYAIDPQVDVNGRSIALRAEIPNTDGVLRPGLFARVELILSERPDALLVPEQAIVPQGGRSFIYRIVDGKAVRTEVTIGQRRDGRAEITSGLTLGDTIVTAGHLRLSDGTAVRVVRPAGS